MCPAVPTFAGTAKLTAETCAAPRASHAAKVPFPVMAGEFVDTAGDFCKLVRRDSDMLESYSVSALFFSISKHPFLGARSPDPT